MADYIKIPTSPEVWAVIRARHPELKPFSSFSDPDGTFNGGPGERGRMETSYGFPNADFPILEASTTWIIDHAQPSSRIEQKNEYWLCIGKQENA